MFNNFGTTLQLAFREALTSIFEFIPKLFGAIILLLVGWFVGKLVGGLVTKGLRAVKFNTIADKAEIDTFLQNAGVKMDPSAVAGAIARWFIYLIFFVAAFNTLGLTQISMVLNRMIAFLPLVIVALVIVLLGALAGNMLAKVVRGSLRSAGVGAADMFGTVARFAVIAFAVLAALDIINIAPAIVNGLWTAMLALLVGALVLAFGLGGRQAAADLTLGRMLRSELEPGVEIQAGEHQGKVRAIGSLFTTLETAQGVIKVPNTALTSQPLKMSNEQYQQQVQKREQMKEKVRQAVQSAGAGTNGSQSRQPAMATAGRKDETNGSRKP